MLGHRFADGFMKVIASVFLAALALALVVALWSWRLSAGLDDETPVEIAVAGVRLRVDPQLARVRADLRHAALEELDLVVTLPDLAPAGAKANAMPMEKLVFMTLRRRDEKLEPRDKPARLYARFLEPLVEAHPAGLILRRFEAGGPYDLETLYMTPPEGRVFWARCTPAGPAGATPATCLSEARIAGLDIRLRFSPDLLEEWEALSAGVLRLVEGMAR
jgi:hypothetical protein